MSLRRHFRPMTAQELGYFFVAETDILAGASPEQRAHLRACNPASDFAAMTAIAGRRAV
jgi:hypothetical protein